MLRLLVFHPLDAGLQGDQLLLDVADPFLGLVLDLGMVGGGWGEGGGATADCVLLIIYCSWITAEWMLLTAYRSRAAPY